MADAKRIPLVIDRLAALSCTSTSEYKPFRREDGIWVIHYDNRTMLQARSEIGLYHALVSYVRGYERALQDAQYLRKG
jgi:hypothetical protein